MLATSTWLRTRRSRCVFLLLFSPILLPFLCVTLPLLCATELCIRLFRRGRGKNEEDGGDRLRRCEEGFCDCEEEEGKEVGLLQRLLGAIQIDGGRPGERTKIDGGRPGERRKKLILDGGLLGLRSQKEIAPLRELVRFSLQKRGICRPWKLIIQPWPHEGADQFKFLSKASSALDCFGEDGGCSFDEDQEAKAVPRLIDRTIASGFIVRTATLQSLYQSLSLITSAPLSRFLARKPTGIGMLPRIGAGLFSATISKRVLLHLPGPEEDSKAS
ncbi:hypothetical protein SADUNF_Sadunf13G0086100 [Salix dunnii]|uniref:Transmembrane protein n=1 Tax=Salix dunnii TaxID=1413687 RepID=A0A835JHY5_9ROSI|nr:hypothetical protein SADUNF_Sadunf13G0086100 [Salix dunnii]